MITVIEDVDTDLVTELVEASHGALDADDIDTMLRTNVAQVITNGTITCGVAYLSGCISFFGWHGKGMTANDLEEVYNYSTSIAKVKGISKLQFVSTHCAWDRLLKPFGFRTSLFVYEKEL